MKNKNILLITIIIGISILASFFASSSPDGLEFVAEKLGFMHKAAEPMKSVMSDYSFPLIKNSGISTAIAGIIGIFLCMLFAYVISGLLSLKIKKR